MEVDPWILSAFTRASHIGTLAVVLTVDPLIRAKSAGLRGGVYKKGWEKEKRLRTGVGLETTTRGVYITSNLYVVLDQTYMYVDGGRDEWSTQTWTTR